MLEPLRLSVSGMRHFAPPCHYDFRTYEKRQGVRNDKNQSKIKKQGVRIESCPEDRNEHQQLIFRDKTLKFDGSPERK
jgi:hypothetical protein